MSGRYTSGCNVSRPVLEDMTAPELQEALNLVAAEIHRRQLREADWDFGYEGCDANANTEKWLYRTRHDRSDKRAEMAERLMLLWTERAEAAKLATTQERPEAAKPRALSTRYDY